MKEEVQKYSWKAQVKAKHMKAIEKQQPGLRGLINIGNCKIYLIQPVISIVLFKVYS